MYTLRLLGTAAIEGSDGPVTGRATQGRRLALLALLALARGRALSRDKLIALLWPDASSDRARPQLSDTLYILRNALGEDVVRSAGDVLELNAGLVTSDVALFERMLEDGRLEDAVALYRGPLLDGFHLADSTELETWVDGERAQLDRRYAQALEALAEAATAAGDFEAAVGWWRKRAVHDPYNGRAALGLMRALDAAGDRAAALQHARIHATLLREEFDAEPDAEITALADRLRREPPAPKAALSPEPIPVLPDTPPDPSPDTDALAPHEPVPELRAATRPQPAPAARRQRAPLSAGRIAVLFALVLGGAVALTYAVGRDAAPAPARSVGVLPFLNMSPDPAHTYFSDGLSEQIILALSRIDGLRVAARTSSFALRNRELSVRAIGDTLGVQAVLEGSVLVDGDRLRVIAQLIDARTGYHIWSEQYDGELRDLFAMQDRVAAAIADALHLRLAGSVPNLAAAPPSIEAYDLYLRGLYLRNTLSEDGLRQAAEYFDGALEREPRFAAALAAKASVVAPLAYFRYADRDAVVAELRVLTERALELDATNGEAHASLGILKLFFDWDWPAAEAALRRAIELNPNDAHAWHHLGNYLSAMGSLTDAIAARTKAVQLDPLNARYRLVLSRDYVLAGDYERALEHAERAARLDPLNPLLLGTGPQIPLGRPDVYLWEGRADEAVEEYLRVAAVRGARQDQLQTLRAAYASSGMPAFWTSWMDMELRESGASVNPVRMSFLSLLAGDTAQALDWLDRAYAERNPALIYLRRDVFRGLLDHPRVARIDRAMKFPD